MGNLDFNEIVENNPVLFFGVTGAVMLFLVTYIFLRPSKHVALKDPSKKITVTLIEKEEVSHDVRRFRFALPDPSMVLGLPIGKCIYVSTMKDGKLVSRPYTPVSSDDDVGYFDLVVKVYFKNVHPKFPDGGILSQHLNDMKMGETVQVKGPIGFVEYKGSGVVTETKKGATRELGTKKIGMIAGGSGITPMLQVIRAVLKNPSDSTELFLLFANQTEEDILLRKELEECAENHSNFKVWYTVDRPPAKWDYSSGFINDEMIAEHLPTNDPNAVFLLCGPPPMINYACLPNFEKLGVKKERILCF